MTPPPGAGDDDALAERLRLAQRTVARLDVEAPVKERAFQRLLAISDAAKHDTTRASARLDRFLADLEAGDVRSSGVGKPPAAQGI